MIIRVPVFFKLILALTLFSSIVLGQNGYESPVLDDDESFTQAFQKRINKSGNAAQPVQQPPVQQTFPARQPAPVQNRGGLLERGTSANQRPVNEKNNSNQPATTPVENEKAAKSSWWQFWKKKEKNPEPENAPSDSAIPQQTPPRAPSNAPRYEQPAPTAYQNSGSGNPVVNTPAPPTTQTHIQTATGTEMKPTAQADIQTPQ